MVSKHHGLRVFVSTMKREWGGIEPRGWNIYLCVLSCVSVSVSVKMSRHACLFREKSNELDFTHVAYYPKTVFLNIIWLLHNHPVIKSVLLHTHTI